MSLVRLAVVSLFVLSGSSAFAQNINPYNPAWVQNTCVPDSPYSLQTECVTYPVQETYAMRYAIAQASLGFPGVELGYVVLLNMERTPQTVLVEYTIPGKDTTYFHVRTLAPNERLALELHGDPTFAGQIFFSLVAYFEKSGYMELARHSRSDFTKETTKAGVLIPRVATSSPLEGTR